MAAEAKRRRVVIAGAAGRDFHNFNVLFRDDPAVEVVAFTAAQIPGIAGRRYPADLAGPLYPRGIPIAEEAELEALCRRHGIDQVMFAYSDVTHAAVMHLGSRTLAAGADFVLAGPQATMLASSRPVIAVCAVRTGCGKSQVTRWLSRRLKARGLRVAAVRHPMPYGDLSAMRVQRFATMDDIAAAQATVEEREEYEPHVAAGSVVFAGVDYADILRAAEAEADVILWDGGNNDFPFYRPDLLIVLADALRPGQLATHHPGEAVLRMADVVVVAKADAAPPGQAEAVAAEAARINPGARVILGASPVTLEDEAALRGKKVLVVEDGPTITHGGMAAGAGLAAAQRVGAAPVDPRGHADPMIAAVFAAWPHIDDVLPAMGYGAEQLAALERTIRDTPADAVVAATPVDLGALIDAGKPVVRVRYEYAEVAEPGLGGVVDGFLAGRGL